MLLGISEQTLQKARGKQAHQRFEAGLGGGIPRLIVFHVPMVGVVGAVADAPPVIRHQDAAVRDVAHQVVQLLVAAEAAMATAPPGHTCPR